MHGPVHGVLDLCGEGDGREEELNHVDVAEDGQSYGGVEMMGCPAGSQD